MEVGGNIMGGIIAKLMGHRAFRAENRFCMRTGAFRNFMPGLKEE